MSGLSIYDCLQVSDWTKVSRVDSAFDHAHLGYLAEETLSESFVGGASGIARDLVGDREWQEGLCQASGDVALEGETQSPLWAA